MPWGTTAMRKASVGTGGMWVGGDSDDTSAPTQASPFPSAKGAYVRPPAKTPHFQAADYNPEEVPDGDAVTSVKELQRSDPAAREQWGLYCENHGNGIRDPNKHSTAFLNNFIALFTSGVRQEGGGQDGNGQANNLADIVKEGQRRSANWKQAWGLYCQSYGGGVNDPSKHDRQFIINFLDFLGQRGVASFNGMMPGNSPMGALALTNGPDGERPAKRPRQAAAPGGLGPGAVTSTGDPEKDSLVTRIKAFQRSGETQKQMWWDYCDERFSGVRDPAKHDKNALEAFLALNASS